MILDKFKLYEILVILIPVYAYLVDGEPGYQEGGFSEEEGAPKTQT